MLAPGINKMGRFHMVSPTNHHWSRRMSPRDGFGEHRTSTHSVHLGMLAICIQGNRGLEHSRCTAAAGLSWGITAVTIICERGSWECFCVLCETINNHQQPLAMASLKLYALNRLNIGWFDVVFIGRTKISSISSTFFSVLLLPSRSHKPDQA